MQSGMGHTSATKASRLADLAEQYPFDQGDLHRLAEADYVRWEVRVLVCCAAWNACMPAWEEGLMHSPIGTSLLSERKPDIIAPNQTQMITLLPR